MKILLIFSLCLISDGGAAMEVTGYSGGGVLIICKYQTKYTQNMKYFCRGSWTVCSDQIKTGYKNKIIDSGRFSLFDETKFAEFRVMIRNLNVWDSGTYQCGVDISHGKDIYTPVKLKVENVLYNEKSISKNVHVGGDLTFECSYPQTFRSDPKFLCKMLHINACTYKESVKESKKYVNHGRFYLSDDRAKQIFNVRILKVNDEDSGEYWCGAEVNWTSDEGYKVYFTQINLRVTEPHVPASSLEPEQTTSSTSAAAATSSTSSTSLTLSSSPLLLTSKQKSESSPKSSEGFSASAVITVSIILLLLLIGGVFFFVILQKRHSMQAGTAATDRSSTQDSENKRWYEEVTDIRHPSPSEAGTSTIYSTAQLPTIPSDPVIFMQTKSY